MRQELEDIAAAVRSASTLTEGRFLELGKRLESAIAILERLTTIFAQLSAELEGEELGATTGSLNEAAQRVAALTGARRGEREALGRLMALTATIDRHLAAIRQSVKTIAVLATNAKIAAAGLGSAGADFVNFSTEIGRSLGSAQANLDAFGGELAGVDKHLGASSAGEAEFDQRHTEALRSIPQRLAAGVTAIAAQRQKAAQAAAAVGTRSQHVQQRVGEAVIALQIGDITRQRLEHVDEAIGFLGAVARGEGEWHGLSEQQRQRLVVECCALQAAQLADSAEQFEREIRRILAALGDLAADARAILGLGTEAYAGKSKRGIFLHELEADVSGARELLDGFSAARRNADRTVALVSDAAGKLVSHINTVRSLEADIRIMGLNTSLKCGRMGDLGRPLSVIAQELRTYANQTAAEAGAIMTAIEQVVAGAAALSGGERERREGDIAEVGQMLMGAVARLAAAGQTFEAALATLEHDSDTVAGLLDDTSKGITLHEEIGRALRDAMERLRALAAGHVDGTEDAGAAATRLMAMIAARYTMAREREIHERAGHGAVTMAPKAAAPAAAEDFLF